MLETLALPSSMTTLDCCSLGQPNITKTNQFLHQLYKKLKNKKNRGSFITRQERHTFGASFSGLFAFEPNTSLPES